MSPSIQNQSGQNEFDRSAGAIDAETTLRIIATLPAPDGLEDRVKAGLRTAPRRAAVISWPLGSANGGRWMQTAGMRAVAAAAIVLVVAGGGWGVYSHIHIAPLPTALSAPQPLNGGGGFKAAGAIRTPRTLEGPVVEPPAIAKEKQNSGKSAAMPPKHGRQPAKNAQLVPPVR